MWWKVTCSIHVMSMVKYSLGDGCRGTGNLHSGLTVILSEHIETNTLSRPRVLVTGVCFGRKYGGYMALLRVSIWQTEKVQFFDALVEYLVLIYQKRINVCLTLV